MTDSDADSDWSPICVICGNLRKSAFPSSSTVIRALDPDADRDRTGAGRFTP